MRDPRSRRPRPWRLALAAGVLGCPAAGALAQPETGPGATAGTLRAVTVTVTPGVEQEAFDTPASIDVIPGEVLRQGQLGINLSESLGRVPGLVVQNRQNYAQDLQISSRGFGARATFGVRGIRLYVDGIPATGPDGQGQVSHFDLASASRLEVLRGPFSVLYGNASGGVISLFTDSGGADTIVEAGTAFGSDGVRRTNAQVSGTAGTARYRLSTTRFSTDGSRAHSAAERTGINAKVDWDATADTRVTLVANGVDMPDVQDPLGLTRAEWEADPRQATPAALQFDTRKSVRQAQVGAIVDHRIDAVHALQATAWRGERDTVQFQSIPVAAQLPPTQPGGMIDLARTYQGLDARWIGRLRAQGRPLTLTAGLAVEEAVDDRRGFQNFAGGRLGVQGALRRDESNRARSVSPYVQGEWVLGERWSAQAGLRHSRVDMRTRDRYVVPGNGDDSGSLRYEATTPAIGLVFHASDTLNLYASLGRGFETPTLNELSYRPGGTPGLNTALQASTSRHWELGVKAEPAPRWRVNAALFGARTDGEIVVLSNTGGRSTFQNAGRTRRNGAEAVLQGEWGSGWSTHVAATWLDARYRDAFRTCAGAPCPVPNTLVPAGKRIPGVPRVSLFAELAWEWRPWGLDLAAEVRHQGRVAVNDANTDFAPAATVLNLRAGLRQQMGRWTVSEFIRIDNVADRRWVGSVIVNEGNGRAFEPAPGRTWLAGVNAVYAF